MSPNTTQIEPTARAAKPTLGAWQVSLDRFASEAVGALSVVTGAPEASTAIQSLRGSRRLVPTQRPTRLQRARILPFLAAFNLWEKMGAEARQFILDRDHRIGRKRSR